MQIDPEAPFWQQIEEQPGEPLPRLVYADWCDEHDRPVMGMVQRWLAATGRVPKRNLQGVSFWVSEDHPLEETVPKSTTLPAPLWKAISRRTPTPRQHCFANQRQAEEALVEAWVQATRSRFLRTAWKPDFQHVWGVLRGQIKPPPAVSAARPPTEIRGVFSWVLVIGYIFLCLIGTRLFEKRTPTIHVIDPPAIKARQSIDSPKMETDSYQKRFERDRLQQAVELHRMGKLYKERQKAKPEPIPKLLPELEKR